MASKNASAYPYRPNFAFQDRRDGTHFHDRAQDNHKEFARGGTLNGRHANFGDTIYSGTTSYQRGSLDQRGALNVRNNGRSNMRDDYSSEEEEYPSQSAVETGSDEAGPVPPPYTENSPQENSSQTPITEPRSNKEDQLKNTFVRCIKIDPHQTDPQQKSHKRLRDKFLVYMGLEEEEREEEICDDLKKVLQVYLHDHEKTGNSQMREQAFKALRAYIHRETQEHLQEALNALGKWAPGAGGV
ncbi:hypothetical protein GYMLUDRAFT_252896 [Collybiopsis luxurians FD-317 M1]|uniref:Unplaced genomic scaffold GYMLUscaffold_149, whole genome shotgun sequence n=1 Tax=Collybiopsis luxurians FD-317 M1 TaxID=944289 RepID=A0A0D0B8T1_9AGAR|nr:hypothetical protein GYMLUDRAFT_252896 [Collybiopsis luxurians FD-317 M1]